MRASLPRCCTRASSWLRRMRLPHAWSVGLRMASSTTASPGGEQGPGEGVLLKASERMRSLVVSRKSGTLTTMASTGNQFPLFASLMPYVLTPEGLPVLALRQEEQHAKHLAECDKASLVVFSLTPPRVNPVEVSLPRVNLAGPVRSITSKSKTQWVRDKYVEVHPGSEPYLDEFTYYELSPEQLIYYPAVSQAVHLDGSGYAAAAVDPLASHVRSLVDWVNDTHGALVPGLVGAFAKDMAVDDAFFYHIDRHGFNVLAQTANDDVANLAADSAEAQAQRWVDYRFPFDAPLTDPQHCQDVLTSEFQRIA